jgi:hypothetical protein
MKNLLEPEELRREEELRAKVMTIILIVVTVILGFWIFSQALQLVGEKLPEAGEFEYSFSLSFELPTLDDVGKEIAKVENLTINSVSFLKIEGSEKCIDKVGYWFSSQEFLYLYCLKENKVFKFKRAVEKFDIGKAFLKSFEYLKNFTIEISKTFQR